MKPFLKKTGLFLAFSFSLSLLLFATLNYVNNQAFVNYKVASNVKSIFIGDSHVQLAIKDKLLSNSVNLAQTSEPLKFSFFKLQTILQNNPAVKKIYLGYSYHSISSYYDDYIDGIYSNNVSARYFFILPFREKAAIIKQKPKELHGLFRSILSNGLKNVFAKEEDLSCLGKYENKFDNVPASKKAMDNRISQQFFENGKPRDFSLLNICYLDSIIELCKNKNVELIILNTPLHPYYKSRIPSKFIEKYHSILEQKNLKLIDFSDLGLHDSQFIPDGDHVSATGSVLTTKQLNE